MGQSGPGNTKEIGAFLHCKMCLDAWLVDKTVGGQAFSPRERARLEVGWTARGLQVWCVIHDVNVMHVDFQGHKHPANVTLHEGAVIPDDEIAHKILEDETT